MSARRRLARMIVGTALSAVVWPLAGLAFANVAVGELLDNDELPTLDGGRAPLMSRKALANVLVFFRPHQDRSLDTLKAMADCEKEFAARAVHWVAVVSSSWSAEEIRETVKESGIQMKVLIDQDDQLYGKLGVRLHPVIAVADDKLRLVAYEPYRRINYCDRIRAKIRFALREIDQAAVERVEQPPKGTMPNEIPNAVAIRHVRLGESLLQRQYWDKAAEQGKIAVEKAPGLAAAHALLGAALAGKGGCGEAMASFERALELDPANREAAAGRKRCGGR